jgi:hypothetical protein
MLELLAVVGAMVVIAFPVWVMSRLRRSSEAMTQGPDDLRRADDGLESNPAGGAGLGPMWPVD